MGLSKITIFIPVVIVTVLNLEITLASEIIRPTIFLEQGDPPEFNFWFAPKIISLRKRIEGRNTYAHAYMIRLTCNSSFPIDWDFNGTFVNRVNIFTRERIVNPAEFTDFHLQSHIFQIHVTIWSHEIGSGLYICKSLQDPTIYDSIHVLTKRQPPKIPVSVQPKRLDQTTIILPCPADIIPFVPTLLKTDNLTGSKFDITNENYVSYNLTQGFTLDLMNIDGNEFLWGTYECHIQYAPHAVDDDDDIDTIEITLNKPEDYIYSPEDDEIGVPTVFHCASVYPIEIRRSWNYDELYPNVTYFNNTSSPYVYNAFGRLNKNNDYTNCFDTLTNRKLKSWYYPVHAQLPLMRVELGEYSEGVIRCSSKSWDSIRMAKYECDVPAQCNFLKKCLEEDISCEETTLRYEDTKIITPRPIVAFCHTKEVGKKRETFLLDLDRNFFRMSDKIDSRNATSLVRIHQVQKIAYVGEKVTFMCVAVRFLFANVHWGFVFQNGTTMLVSTKGLVSDSTEFHGIVQLRKTTFRMNDKSVSQVGCFAPFGNSFEWAIAKHDISVQGSILYNANYNQQNNCSDLYRNLINSIDQQPPSVMGKDTVEPIRINSNGNGTRLVCQVISHPPPNITWAFGNSQEILRNFKIDTNRIDDEKIISVLTLNGETQGNEYDCIATNLFGSTKKRFQTYVSNGLHPGLILAIVVPIVIFVIIIFFLIRFHRQKLKKLENLLSEKDIKDFLEGQPESDPQSENDPQSKAFPEEYRINREDLSFDPTAILGSGAYGIVWRGNLNKIINDQPLSCLQYENIGYPVAVKTVKRDAGVQHVKSLLAEIKTMVYTGTHQHIVTFLGACIQNITQNEIYVALEFCDNGSLESYIRDRRDHFEETADKTKIGQLNVRTLIRWSYEISQAMIHLAEMKVIHGDLATRNVLLTNSLTAKVSDFGLAKQLYNYSQYTRKGKMLLPWRWMAIESLQDMEFSTKSDVWSFGITLWEIFSLCEVPFGGLGYTLEYINMLKLGLRPMQPTLASNQIYGIMTQCWDSDSSKRPTIEVIGGMLSILRLENNDNKDSTVATYTVESLPSVAVINWKSPLETDDYAHYI